MFPRCGISIRVDECQLFTAGRYEYRNKGVDMFIESLAREWIPHTSLTSADCP